MNMIIKNDFLNVTLKMIMRPHSVIKICHIEIRSHNSLRLQRGEKDLKERRKELYFPSTNLRNTTKNREKFRKMRNV